MKNGRKVKGKPKREKIKVRRTGNGVRNYRRLKGKREEAKEGSRKNEED